MYIYVYIQGTENQPEYGDHRPFQTTPTYLRTYFHVHQYEGRLKSEFYNTHIYIMYICAIRFKSFSIR